MRKLPLLLVAAVAVAAFQSMSPPPVEDLVLAQAPCRSGTAICIGDKRTKTVVGGNISVSSTDGGFSVSETGAVTAPSIALTAGSTSTFGTVRAAIVDAGTMLLTGELGLSAATSCPAAAACGTCNLASASPSTCTATVASGSSCVCWPIGTTAAIAAGGCAANVSSTTATFTGPNTVTTTVRYLCFR